MKGLTHFLSGVALSSFFAPAVRMASTPRSGLETAEASFILLLGGLYGIMPDTLDFKLGQFFSPAEIDIDCNPEHLDPQRMAREIGEAMDKAYQENRTIKVQLFPIRMGNNLWRQYVIQFDGATNEVVVIINEIVSTSQVSYPGTEPKENRVGRYQLRHGKILETHGRPSVVDIMSGPQYAFVPDGQNVLIEFLPWHRTWSHSYVLGLILATPWWLIAFLFGFSNWWLYGLIAFLGFAIHLTEDLTGHMGGSLIWPFYRKRSNGLCLFKASDPRANFSVDYAAAVITIFNLDRFTTNIIPISWTWYYLIFLVLPITLYLGVYWLFDRGLKQRKDGELSADEALRRESAGRKAREALIRFEELAYEEDQVPGG
ncbi:metal-dependent hydrolase [bacterium]|nr:metal-dependent hydrolase [candidate division CSSED10-310 bacterium]